jgi:predicted Zn-dependent protease
MKSSLSAQSVSPLLRLLTAAVLTLAAPALLVSPVVQAQNLPSLGGTDGEELSPQMERKLGEQVMFNIQRDRDYLSDPTVMEYLNNFGASLLAASPEARGEAGYDFLFFAVRDPVLNAFALPGGFIGVHSALVIAAQSESELASVLAHEIGHVSQRHIARMIGSQRQDSLLPLAGLLIAALAARSSPDLAGAAMMGGAGVAASRQLSFTRDAEREADRVGLQILGNAGFETTGMVNFFGRLQVASRNTNDTAPSYLRTHPLTTERIADIEARIRNQPYRQHADSLDFSLIKSRLRILQDDTPQGWRDAAAIFAGQARQGSRSQMLAGRYGMAVLALRQRDPVRAQALLNDIQAEMERNPALPATSMLTTLAIEIKLASQQPEQALQAARAARVQFPLSRAVKMQFADCLLAAGKSEEASLFLRDQAQLYRQDSAIQQVLARAYAEQGKQALQHIALAEFYSLTGSLPAALEQLKIARGSADASFYDQAMIDARERELQTAWREVVNQGKKQR